MSNFLNEELRHKFNWMRDEMARIHSQVEERLRGLEAENDALRNRLGVLTRLLISKQIVTAEEIATALTETSRPVPSGEPEPDQAT